MSKLSICSRSASSIPRQVSDQEENQASMEQSKPPTTSSSSTSKRYRTPRPHGIALLLALSIVYQQAPRFRRRKPPLPPSTSLSHVQLPASLPKYTLIHSITSYSFRGLFPPLPCDYHKIPRLAALKVTALSAASGELDFECF